MSDYEDKVLPVAPVVGKKIVKVNSFDIEQKQNQPFSRKKAVKDEKPKQEAVCIITPEKVDCQI